MSGHVSGAKGHVAGPGLAAEAKRQRATVTQEATVKAFGFLEGGKDIYITPVESFGVYT